MQKLTIINDYLDVGCPSCGATEGNHCFILHGNHWQFVGPHLDRISMSRQRERNIAAWMMAVIFLMFAGIMVAFVLTGNR